MCSNLMLLVNDVRVKFVYVCTRIGNQTEILYDMACFESKEDNV